MNSYNPKYHHRRSIRLKGYDYAQAGLYFITLCIQDHEHIFGKIHKGEMRLNAFGEIANNEWLNTPNIRYNVALHEHIIMPNHMHGIIEIKFKKAEDYEIGAFQSPSHSIGSIIRGYKIATIKRIKDFINISRELEEKKKFKGKEKEKNNRCELKFAPTASTPESAPIISPDTGELQFAPAAPTASTIKKIINLNFKIWQRNYYEHIIRNEKAYKNIAQYIINNPRKWEEDKFHKNSD